MEFPDRFEYSDEVERVSRVARYGASSGIGHSAARSLAPIIACRLYEPQIFVSQSESEFFNRIGRKWTLTSGCFRPQGDSRVSLKGLR